MATNFTVTIVDSITSETITTDSVEITYIEGLPPYANYQIPNLNYLSFTLFSNAISSDGINFSVPADYSPNSSITIGQDITLSANPVPPPPFIYIQYYTNSSLTTLFSFNSDFGEQYAEEGIESNSSTTVKNFGSFTKWAISLSGGLPANNTGGYGQVYTYNDTITTGVLDNSPNIIFYPVDIIVSYYATDDVTGTAIGSGSYKENEIIPVATFSGITSWKATSNGGGGLPLDNTGGYDQVYNAEGSITIGTSNIYFYPNQITFNLSYYASESAIQNNGNPLISGNYAEGDVVPVATYARITNWKASSSNDGCVPANNDNQLGFDEVYNSTNSITIGAGNIYLYPSSPVTEIMVKYYISEQSIADNDTPLHTDTFVEFATVQLGTYGGFTNWRVSSGTALPPGNTGGYSQVYSANENFDEIGDQNIIFYGDISTNNNITVGFYENEGIIANNGDPIISLAVEENGEITVGEYSGIRRWLLSSSNNGGLPVGTTVYTQVYTSGDVIGDVGTSNLYFYPVPVFVKYYANQSLIQNNGTTLNTATLKENDEVIIGAYLGTTSWYASSSNSGGLPVGNTGGYSQVYTEGDSITIGISNIYFYPVPTVANQVTVKYYANQSLIESDGDTLNSTTYDEGASITIRTFNNIKKWYLSSNNNGGLPENVNNYTVLYRVNNTITLGSSNLYFYPAAQPICFKEDSKILCLKDDNEVEVKIQDLRPGDLVKTVNKGYLKVTVIGKSVLNNTVGSERVKDKLYKCSKEVYPELNEDLYITGGHAILVNTLTLEQQEKIKAAFGRLFITSTKYRLMAFIDERTEPCVEGGDVNIYHFALENDEICYNYGVYANGLLVECCNTTHIMKRKNMLLIE